ncbi:MAG: response regulator [Flavobacteriales bacterium]
MKAIVCVDDEPSILRALQQQIMRTMEDSFQLEFAESGEEALEVIGEMRDRNIDLALLITDEMMPGMKGHTLIERILTQSSSTPCILLTGYAQSEIINQITATYPITCMSKPWDAEELINEVRRLTA